MNQERATGSDKKDGNVTRIALTALLLGFVLAETDLILMKGPKPFDQPRRITIKRFVPGEPRH